MQEHGSFEMHVHEQIISIKVFGAWNFETTARWCAEYRNHIESVKNAPWSRILDLTLWELTTPDVWELVDEVNTWANINNQKFEVVICPFAIQQKLLEKAHQVLTNVEIKYCENLQEAHKWLDNQSV